MIHSSADSDTRCAGDRNLPIAPARRSHKDTWPIIDYLGVALLIFLPVLGPGYVLIEDMVFTPYPPPLTPGDTFLPLFAIFHVVATILPMWLIQKVLLLGIIVVAGCGAYHLAECNGARGWTRHYAGLLYTVNPLVYERLMYGQWNILFAYALLPWAMLLLISARHASFSWQQSIGFGFLWAAMLSVDTHMIFIFGLMLALVSLIVGLSRQWRHMRNLIIAAVTCALLSTYWVVPALMKTSTLATQVSQLSVQDMVLYSTVPDPHLGLIINLLAGYGFWAERGGRFMLPKAQMPLWWLFTFAIIALTIWGAVRCLGNRSRRPTTVLCLGGMLGLTLALGVSAPGIDRVVVWLASHVPLYRSMRDSAKWLELLMLMYAILGAIGLSSSGESDVAHNWTRARALSRKIQRGLPAFLVVPVLTVPTLLWGAQGQLHTAQYPVSWLTVRHELASRPAGQEETLFLPWHLYLSFPFTRSVMGNPASLFFPHTISGDNLEFGTYSTSQSSRSTEIADAFVNHPSGIHAAALISHYHFCTILLAKTVDWHRYEPTLRATPHLSSVEDFSDLRVYTSTNCR